MAVMNINIGSVPIDLIANQVEQSNSCVSVFTFDIISTPNANITIQANQVNNQRTDFDTLTINGVNISRTSLPYTFSLGSTGTAKASLKIGNATPIDDPAGTGLSSEGSSGNYLCNVTEIIVTDNTNTKTESQIFTRCNDAARCNEPEDLPELTIDNDTNVYIYFDSSGSMDSTLAPLQTMRDTLLKNALLPYYNNDEVLYNSKVQVIEHASERTLHMLDILGTAPASGKVIALVFQDEAQPIYTGATGWTINSVREPQYDTDMTALRTRLDSYAANHYRGVIFQVNTGTQSMYVDFKALVKAMKYSSGVYTGNSGLANRTEFNYKFDVAAGSTAEYYKNLVVTALQELGFTI